MDTVTGTIRALEARIPMARAAGWDAVGLQVGDPDDEVGRVGVCHDVTSGVIQAAVDADVDLLIAYHPLLFNPSRRFVAGSGPAGRAWQLARAGISLAVVHTAFDVVAGGAADALAESLDLADIAPFGPLWGPDRVKVITFAPPDAVDSVADAMSAAGAGWIGRYSGCSFRSEGVGTFRPEAGADPWSGVVGETSADREVRIEMVADAPAVARVVAALVRVHPYEEPAFDVVERRGDAGFVGRYGAWSGALAELVDVVDNRLEGPALRVVGEPDRAIEVVAVVPGSGASELDAARALGVDVVVTGDIKHHDARRAADLGMALIDAGHAATERPGLVRLYAAVSEMGVESVDLTGVDADPWIGSNQD